MTLKRVAAALAVVLVVFIVMGSLGDSSVTVNNREIEGPLKVLVVGVGALVTLMVGGLILASAGVLIAGILAVVGVVLFSVFTPVLALFLLFVFVIYWIARCQTSSNLQDRSV